MSADKWKMFKNFMHNELGIGKEEIRGWIREAAHEEAKKLVGQAFASFSINQIIDRYVIDKQFFGNDRIKDEIQKRVATELSKQIILNVKPPTK